MSVYQERWILHAKETGWSTWTTPNTFDNYTLEWEAATTEGSNEEELIAGARDLVSKAWTDESCVARELVQVISGKQLEYCLGSHLTANSLSPFTISVGATLPSRSFYRGLYPPASGETGTISLGYKGMKVDTLELTIERGEDVRLEMNMAGWGSSVPSAIAKPTVSTTIPIFGFQHAQLVW